MVHVHLTQPAGPNRPPSLTIDGVEMSKKILAEGFRITFDHATYEHHIHMIVAADVLEVELPEAVIDALRQPSPDRRFCEPENDNEPKRVSDVA